MEKQQLAWIIVLIAIVSIASTIRIEPIRAITITVPDEYSTIQEAVNAASSEDTIYVHKGTYYEHVILNKTVSLIGEDPSTTIIDGNETGTVVLITVQQATVTGFTIQRGNYGIYMSSIMNNTTLKNNIVINNQFGCKTQMSASTFSNNTISNNTLLGVEICGNDNEVLNNTVNNNGNYGIYLLQAGSSIVSYNLVFNNDNGIIITWLSYGSISYNTAVSNNGTGIGVYSPGVVLKNNSMSNNRYNFDVSIYYNQDIDTSNTVNGKPIYYWVNQHNKKIPNDAGYVIAKDSTNITVKDLNLEHSATGILFSNVNDSNICDNFVSNNYQGIVIEGSQNTICDNFVLNNYEGIVIEGSYNTVCQNILSNNSMSINMPCSYPDARIHNNNVSYNIVTKSTYGMFLGQFGGIPEAIGPTNDTISDNVITSNEYGITVCWTSTCYNFLCNNIIANNTHGLFLGGYENVLRNNMITNNKCNFEASFTFNHDIDTSNTVNGRPIYYLTDRSNTVIDPSTFPNIGYLGIINAANILVKDLNLTGNGQGLLLVHVTNSTVKNVNISNSTEGIYMYGCASNNITDNVITNSSGDSIYVESSQNNTLQGNFLSNNLEAFYLHGSYNNLVHNNMISNNGGGIYIDYSKENNIYHNNFINNTWQTKIYPESDWWSGPFSINKWDNDLEGNYWSDYNGTDADHDGIGDTPYVIDADNIDHYPMIEIIPEFPSFLILLLFMIATLLAVIVYRKKHAKISRTP